MSGRENETVRDRFFRVLWIATLIWRLAEFPLPDHVAVLDDFLREARLMNPDGTQKTPKKRKAKSPDKSTPAKKQKKENEPKKTPAKKQKKENEPKKPKKGKK